MRFGPEERRGVQRRLATQVAHADVRAAVKQDFGDGRILPRQHRLEERCPAVAVALVNVSTAPERGGDAAQVVGHQRLKEFPPGLTISSSFGARCGVASRDSPRTSVSRRARNPSLASLLSSMPIEFPFPDKRS